MEPTHAASLPELAARVNKMLSDFPYRKEPKTTSSTLMAASKSRTKRGCSSPPQYQPATPEELHQGSHSHILREDTDAEYQLRTGYSDEMRRQVPRYLPLLDLPNNVEDNTIILDTLPIRRTVLQKPASMIPSSPDASQPHTPGSSECSQQPSALA